MKKFLVGLTAMICAVICSLSFIGCGAKENKVNVKYFKDGSLVVSALKTDTVDVGMVPEPAASMLEKSDTSIEWYRLSVQDLYDGQTKAYPQAVLMVKSSLLKAYPEIVSNIESKMADNVSWVKSNATTALTAIKNIYPNTTLKAPMLSATTIDNCKIYFQSATDAKTSVNKYIDEIRAISETSANIVPDSFFYAQEQKSGVWINEGISVYAPDGAPAIALAKFINDNDDLGTGKNMSYNIVSSGEIVGKMAMGVADVILMPLNGATKMYANFNANDPYQLVSVVTHGNFYLMSKTPINSLNDVVGKKVGVPNQNAVPDWTLQTIFAKNNLERNVID